MVEVMLKSKKLCLSKWENVVVDSSEHSKREANEKDKRTASKKRIKPKDGLCRRKGVPIE